MWVYVGGYADCKRACVRIRVLGSDAAWGRGREPLGVPTRSRAKGYAKGENERVQRLQHRCLAHKRAICEHSPLGREMTEKGGDRSVCKLMYSVTKHCTRTRKRREERGKHRHIGAASLHVLHTSETFARLSDRQRDETKSTHKKKRERFSTHTWAASLHVLHTSETFARSLSDMYPMILRTSSLGRVRRKSTGRLQNGS